jgi:hypothetical protein
MLDLAYTVQSSLFTRFSFTEFRFNATEEYTSIPGLNLRCFSSNFIAIMRSVSGNFLIYSVLLLNLSRAIAQAVSLRLPTTAARVRAQVRSCGVCGGQSGIGTGFLRVLRFPLPIPIPPTAPHSSSSIIRGWYNRPISGRRTKWTQSHPTPRY